MDAACVRRSFIAAFAVVLVGFSHLTHAAVGATPGNFSVNANGDATYSIPIVAPPGTAGMEPNITLTYTKSVDNPLVGVGFSISGLSIIQRCGRTIALDGVKGGVNHDGDDRFCLDGQRLLATQGAYGANGTEYRTERETFSKIVSYDETVCGVATDVPANAAAGSGPACFKVTTKEGVEMEYGVTTDARIEAAPKADVPQRTVRLWALNKVQDAKGNYYTVTFQENNSNSEYHPARIDYSGNSGGAVQPYNSVCFVYDNDPATTPACNAAPTTTRPDILPRYEAGSIIKVTRRLSHVLSYADSTLVRSYRLMYDNNGAASVSRLIRLQECGADGVCLNPTLFGWQNGGPGNVMHWSNSSGNRGAVNDWEHYFTDVNGDGRADWIQVSRTTNAGMVGLARADGTFEHWTNTSAQRGALRDFEHHFADVNGDGRADWIQVHRTSNNAWIGFGQADGSFEHWTFTTATNVAGRVDWYASYFADVNGDGRADWIQVARGSNAAHIGLANPDGSFTYWSSYFYSAGAVNNYEHYFADVNGDGRADWIQVSRTSNAGWVALAKSDGSFDQWTNYSPYRGAANSFLHYFVDLNGDGHADWIQVSRGENAGWVGLANGDGTFTYWTNYSTARGATNNFEHYFADINGDGRPDWIQVSRTQNAGWIGLGNGDGTFTHWTNYSTSRGTMSDYRHYFADVNGDGMQDWIQVNRASNIGYVGLAEGLLPDLLTSITNGLGAATTIAYKPLTDSTVYTKGFGADWQNSYQDVQSPMQVVSRVTQSDGLGGSYGINYHYHGAKVHRTGPGWLGFARIDSVDERTNVKTSTEYSQVYDGTQGQVTYVATSINGATSTITTKQNFLEGVALGSGRTLARLNGIVEQTNELNGSPVSVVTTDYVYDSYNNPTSVTKNYGDGHVTTTTNTYDNREASWILGLLLQNSVASTTPAEGSGARVTTFTYDSAGLLSTEVKEPAGSADVKLTTSYTRDAFGNVLTTTLTGGTTSRPTTNVYDARGQFIVQTRNALNHSETKEYDPKSGKPTRLTGPNGLVTTWNYDGFGRQILETRADGTSTTTAYELSPFGYAIRTQVSGNAPTFVHYDILGRERRTETVGFDDMAIYKDTEYNNVGQVSRSSRRYVANATAQWTNYLYDIIGRVVQSTEPNGLVTTTQYTAHVPTGTVTTINKNERQFRRTEIRDPQQRLVRVRDAYDQATDYTYDAFANLASVTDARGNVTRITYDARGRKTGMTDPDMGAWSYIHNAFGELRRQQDAKAQVSTFVYDALGRMTSRTAPEGTSLWTYDTQPQGIGQLATVTGPNGPGSYLDTALYDSVGRPRRTETRINGELFATENTYDSASRVDTRSFPTGFAVRNIYRPTGHLWQVVNAATGELYWRAENLNADDRIEQATLGNGLGVERAYYPTTGRLQRAQIGSLQHLSFDYDRLGSLGTRIDHVNNVTETATYDALNRLTASELSSPAGSVNKTFQYDELGNLTFKTGVGTYTYATRPHAVTQTSGTLNHFYDYDQNGNLLTGGGRSISYTSFNKPLDIVSGNGALASFTYGPDQNRIIKTTPTKTTVYVGTLYERDTAGSLTEHKHSILAGDELIALYTQRSNGVNDTRYLHTDHLGSISAITREDATRAESLSYDAYGKRREANGQDATAPIVSLTDYGYTGEEHDDEAGLINLNARLYDPTLGRFITPDPIVPDPTEMQAFNRYTYANNNPLLYVDPTGNWYDDSSGGYGYDSWWYYGGYSNNGYNYNSTYGSYDSYYNYASYRSQSAWNSFSNTANNFWTSTRQTLGTFETNVLFPTLNALKPTGEEMSVLTGVAGLALADGPLPIGDIAFLGTAAGVGLYRLGRAGEAFVEGVGRIANGSTRTGYHATHPEVAESILQDGFKSGTKPGRLGSGGVYVNDTSGGALAEFAYHNPGVTPSVLQVEYRLGINANASVAPRNYISQHPLNVDSISAPSLRAPGTTNTNILNGSAVPVRRVP